VVAQNVNDGFGWKVALRPNTAFATNINISRQYNYICFGGWDSDHSEFQVKIAENVQAHR
jgi:hypothetical protein